MAVDESTYTQDHRSAEGDDPGTTAVREAAAGHVTEHNIDSATEWFLSDEPLVSQKNVEINVGTDEAKRWITWTITSVDGEVLKRIRREGESGGNRRQRRAGGASEIDPQEANARIVVEGTISPDLAEVARRKGLPETADPKYGAVQVLKHRLRDKPGLIDQLAGEIMSLSGYDEEDLRESLAAKNS
jgi:hypothetical protein